MDSVDLDILKYCSELGNYNDVKGLVSKEHCVKESWLLLQAFGKYYDETGAGEVTKDFKTWFRVAGYPHFKKDTHELYARIIDNVLVQDMPEGTGFLKAMDSLRTQGKLADILSTYKSGMLSADELNEELIALTNTTTTAEILAEEIDVNELAEHARHGGLYWRLEDLNKSVGPISGGDFILVGKRPEVGGTSFLCSEMTYMLEQLPPDSSVVLFNNEEEQHKLKSRVVSTALGRDHLDIMSDPNANTEYYKWLDGKKLFVVHDTQMTVHSIRRAIEQLKPSVVGINVLLKVGGVDRKEDHDKLEQLGVTLRAMSDDYDCPILAIAQADPQADGVKYIPQTWIYKSKTALQGECDVLIMIGTDEEGKEEDRYIHVAKNKIPPSDCTEMSHKHIKSHVHFDIGTGRFTSHNWKTHSKEKGYVYSPAV